MGLVLIPFVIHFANNKIKIMIDPKLNESRRKNMLTLCLYKSIIAQSILYIPYYIIWIILAIKIEND